LSPLYKPPRGLSHEGVHLQGTEHCVRAAEEHGVRKIVQLSGLGVSPTGPTSYLRAKGRAEQVVEDADLAHTIVRPSVIFGDGGEFVSFVKKLTTPYVTALPGGGRTRFQPIWVEDIAPMVAACVDGAHDGACYEIGGPDRLNLADVTRLVWRSQGKSVRIIPVPLSLAKLGLALAGPLPGIPFGADQGRSLELDNVTDDNAIGTFGVEADDLRTLADYLGIR
ncbi:MAG: NAD(P)H-binding protein, partial [Halobacteriales archaeon]|nr:NAD(P)H-binding protein [Halobacteriales archaeon]